MGGLRHGDDGGASLSQCNAKKKKGARIGKSIGRHGMDNKRLLSGKQKCALSWNFLNCAAISPRPQLPAQLQLPRWLRRQNRRAWLAWQAREPSSLAPPSWPLLLLLLLLLLRLPHCHRCQRTCVPRLRPASWLPVLGRLSRQGAHVRLGPMQTSIQDAAQPLQACSGSPALL